MATFYFDNSVDGNWQTLGNWWADAGFSVPATALPTAADDVVISPTGVIPSSTYAGVATNSGAVPVVANMTVYHSGAASGSYTAVAIEVTVTGLATFDGGFSYLYTQTPLAGPAKINGNCLFINGASAFSDGPAGDAVVNGDATFSIQAYNQAATVTGNATFNDDSYNNGLVSGNATFNDQSRNDATVNGNATFNSNAFNSSTGGVAAAATFNDSSYNWGTVGGNATFNDSSHLDGIVGGSTTFNDTAYCVTAGASGPITFNDTSYNQGNAYNDCTFNDSSYSNGYSSGNATFNDESFISFGSVAGNVVFNGNAYADNATMNGDVTFRGSSYNRTGIGGNITIAYARGINGSSILGVA